MGRFKPLARDADADTWLDTRALIERGDVAEGKAAIETQMSLNHKAGLEMIAAQGGIFGFVTDSGSLLAGTAAIQARGVQ